MKWHSVVVLLLIVALSLGSFVLVPVPVARAVQTYTVELSSTTYSLKTTNNGYYDTLWLSSLAGDYSFGMGDAPLSQSFIVDGVNHTLNGYQYSIYPQPGWTPATMTGGDAYIAYHEVIHSQQHTLVWDITWGGQAGLGGDLYRLHWAGSWSGVTPAVGAEINVVALSSSLTGPVAVDLVSGGIWTATAAGGTSPYTFTWVWGKTPPHWAGSVIHSTAAADDFVKVLTAGNWTVQCTVTDDNGGSVMNNMAVTAAVIAGAYTVHFARSGSHGQYVDVYVLDSSGVPVTITGSANTEFGQFGSDGLFGWNAANDEAFQSGSIPGFSGYYVWRYDMSSTVDLVTFAPNGDFWLHSWLHLAVSNLDIEIMHHWNSTLELAGQHWYNENGDSVGAEVPPGATVPEVPEAYQWLWNWILKIFSYLFVPTTAQVQEMAVSISDSSFNPFNNADGTPVSWPAAVDSITLLQHENIGTSEDVIIPLEDNSVFATVRLGVKFAISFSVVMLVLGAL